MPAKQYLLVFVTYLVVAFSLTSQAVFAPLNFEDEHQLLNAANPNLSIKEKMPVEEDFSSLSNYLMDEIKLGRLKPISRTVPWCITKLTNANPLALHTYLLLCVAITLTLFFAFLKKLNVTTWLAFLGGLVLLAGRYDEIWWRIGPGELLALLFLLAGLVATLNYSRGKSKRLYIPLLFFALSALSKESFAFTLPVIAFLLLLNKGFAGKNKKVIIGISSVFSVYCIVLAVVIILTGSTYGWENKITFFQLAKENLISFSKPWLLWIPIAAWLIISPYKRIAFPIGISLLLWLCFQLLIHYKLLVIDSTRYLVPAQLFLITISLLATNHVLFLKKQVGLILVFFLGLYCVLGMKNVLINSSYFGKRATAYHALLNNIEEENPTTVLLVLNNDTPTEYITAVATFLSQKGSNANIEYTRLEQESKPQTMTDHFYTSLVKSEHNFLVYKKRANASSYDVIAFLEPREDVPAIFIDSKEHRIQKITENFFNFSFKSFLNVEGKKQSNSITYLALTK